MLLRSLLAFLLIAGSSAVFSQQGDAATGRPPIIDIHVHTLRVNPAFTTPLCPWFLSDMPGGDPRDPAPPIFNSDCADPLPAAASDDELREAILARIRDLNMTMVAFGDPGVLHEWAAAAPPGLILPGIGINTDMPVADFRDSLSSGFYRVVAEVAPQYRGMSPSDTVFTPYFSVAEELNIPVGIHMGTGGNGQANIGQPAYRASLGNPLLLEDLLARHPKMKIWVMHAGYPLVDELIALMGAHAYVYLDVSGFIWSYPLDEVHYVIRRLVQAGFGKRIMYGTDFIYWPRMIETSIGVIENARYLSADQKRDILFNNAARFFRMNHEDFAWPTD
ncbi:amidohydrolase family protein [Neolewinella litorea]|uniref:Amidohydrolase n=1 Tax=Neolewinella litorea TaxID=2562452 RepID=A0A4S4NE28_9BACT|nr:amidohydrolase family protein [Neolewinella litorea]THH37774.1 amidohydrolase [Neolewinella litorea]